MVAANPLPAQAKHRAVIQQGDKKATCHDQAIQRNHHHFILQKTKWMLVAKGQCTGWAWSSFSLISIGKDNDGQFTHWKGRNVDIPNGRYFHIWNLHVYLTKEISYFCSFSVNRLNSVLNASWCVNIEDIKKSRSRFCLYSYHHSPQSPVADSLTSLEVRIAYSPKGQPQFSKTFQHRSHK